MTQTFLTNITVTWDADGTKGIFTVPTESGKKVLTMAEYITKEQVIEWFRPYGHTDEGIPYYGLVTDIREMKAADVAPVLHGRWEWLGPNRLVTDCMCGTCSACKVRSKYIVNTMLCPNCGAKMDLHGECEQEVER